MKMKEESSATSQSIFVTDVTSGDSIFWCSSSFVYSQTSFLCEVLQQCIPLPWDAKIRSSSGSGKISLYFWTWPSSVDCTSMLSFLDGPPFAIQDRSSFTARTISSLRSAAQRSRRDDLDDLKGGRVSSISRVSSQHLRDRQSCLSCLQTWG